MTWSCLYTGGEFQTFAVRIELERTQSFKPRYVAYAAGKQLCNPNSFKLSLVNTRRRESSFAKWRYVTRPCVWSTRKRQLQALREVGQPWRGEWRCQEPKLVKWQLRMRKKKDFILTAVICQNGILTRERFIWNQIGIKKALLILGGCGKLHRLFLGTFGRRIGVELWNEPATSKFLVSSSPNIGT